MVVASPAGQYISITAGGRGGGMGRRFPSSLMGNIAYIRQIYLDADHYKLVKDAYAKDPGGMAAARIRSRARRRARFAAHSPARQSPGGNGPHDPFRRGTEAAGHLYGGARRLSPEAVELLKKSNAPMLLSMRWPEASRDADPDEVESMRTLETRDKAALAPAVLQKAGVKFAFYSDGLDQPRDLQRAVKKAIDAGLSREDALRALTLSPAEIYGVADRLGSIEKGKIANLVVTRGEIFDDRTQSGNDLRGWPQI